MEAGRLGRAPFRLAWRYLSLRGGVQEPGASQRYAHRIGPGPGSFPRRRSEFGRDWRAEARRGMPQSHGRSPRRDEAHAHPLFQRNGRLRGARGSLRSWQGSALAARLLERAADGSCEAVGHGGGSAIAVAAGAPRPAKCRAACTRLVTGSSSSRGSAGSWTPGSCRHRRSP